MVEEKKSLDPLQYLNRLIERIFSISINNTDSVYTRSNSQSFAIFFLILKPPKGVVRTMVLASRLFGNKNFAKMESSKIGKMTTQNPLLSTPEFTLESKLPPPSSIRVGQSARKLDLSDIDNSFGRQTPTEELDDNNLSSPDNISNNFKGISPLLPSNLTYEHKECDKVSPTSFASLAHGSMVAADIEHEQKQYEKIIEEEEQEFVIKREYRNYIVDLLRKKFNDIMKEERQDHALTR